jgi:hypothetical protein
LIVEPMMMLLPLTCQPSVPKSGVPPSAPMIPPMKSFANAVTTAPNATPITTATARSMTFPRNRKSRNPLIIACAPLRPRAG